MQQQKIVFVTGNENQGVLTLLIGNLLVHKKGERNNPLFVETTHKIFSSAFPLQKYKIKGLKLFEYHPDLDITTVALDKLKEEKKNAGSSLPESADEFSDIFLYDEVNYDTLPLIEKCDGILAVIKNDSYASGYLYKLLKFLKENKIYKKVFITLGSTKYIEDAAGFYLKLREEMTALLGNTPDLNFNGFISIDFQKLAIAQQYRMPFIKLFPDAPFHGMIKYISTRLDMLDLFYKYKSFIEILTR